MKGTTVRRLVVCLLVLFGVAILTESCRTGRGRNCGCGSDILGNYKAPKRFR